jgi:hypothetical protein
MIKLIDLITERDDFKRKETGKKSFHTYSIVFVLKVDKKINRTDMIERIRAIPSVTIVDLRGDEKFNKMNTMIGKDYEYTSVDIKFITNKDPHKVVEDIKNYITTTEADKEKYRIKGVYNAVPNLKTLEKVKSKR